MGSFSQASQDLFYLKMLKYKSSGTFLEIGSNHPITHNNTYLAESKYGWKGIMVEYDPSFAPLYKKYRPNSIHVIQDACTVNYLKILDDNNFPKNMDYLQIDLDVDNCSTRNFIEHLDNTVLEKYTFATITFEHDIYSGNYFDTQKISRDILNKRGYKLICPNVSVPFLGSDVAFEDWYIHPSLIKEYKYVESGLDHTKIISLI